MTPAFSKELKRCLWITVGSFFLTPLALWFFVTVILQQHHLFRRDYLDFYWGMISPEPELVVPWTMILAPAFLYELGLATRHYYRHPDEIRKIFEFPKRR